MKRTIEKRVLIVAGIWNIITATLTIVGYSTWFKSEGVNAFSANGQLNYLNTSMLDSLVSIIMVFGLLIFAIGVCNLYLSKKINTIQKNWRMNTWLIICVSIHFFSFDLIGTLLYLVTLVIYMARTKAIKLNNNVAF